MRLGEVRHDNVRPITEFLCEVLRVAVGAQLVQRHMATETDDGARRRGANAAGGAGY